MPLDPEHTISAVNYIPCDQSKHATNEVLCQEQDWFFYTKLLPFCKQNTVQQSLEKGFELTCLPSAACASALPGTVSTPNDISDLMCAAVKHSITAVAMMQDGVTYTAARKASLTLRQSHLPDVTLEPQRGHNDCLHTARARLFSGPSDQEVTGTL